MSGVRDVGGDGMRYEYMTYQLSYIPHNGGDPTLDQYGREGWEAYAVTGGDSAPYDNQSNSSWMRAPHIVWLRRASGYQCETCQQTANAMEALK
jgi:hypothetical protein